MKAFLTSAPVYLPPAREKTAATIPKSISYTLVLACSWFLLEVLCRCHQEFEHGVPLSPQRQQRISPKAGWTGRTFHSVYKFQANNPRFWIHQQPSPTTHYGAPSLWSLSTGPKAIATFCFSFSRVADTTRTFSSALCLHLTFQKGSSA